MNEHDYQPPAADPSKWRLPPAFIEILVHIYSVLSPFPRPDAPILRDAIAMFKYYGMIVPADGHPGHKCTTRGAALVEMLCRTPPPEPAFVDPRTNEIVLG